MREAQKKLACGIGLATQLRGARADVDQNVWMVLQQSCNAGQVLATLSHMRSNEDRLRVPGEDAVALIEQLLFGVLRAVKSPLRMRRQLLISLVLRVNRQEE